MRRHTSLVKTSAVAARTARSLAGRCGDLLHRIPLLPTVAGACMVMVVATAIGTSQISLSFSNNPPGQSPCTGESCREPTANVTHSDTPEAVRPEGRPSTRKVPPARPALPTAPSAARSRRGEGVGAVGQSPAAAARPTARPGLLRVAFKVVERLPDGYVTAATITNRSSRAITDWTLSLRVREEASVVHAWDVDVVSVGRQALVRNWPDDPQIAPGKSVEVDFAVDGPYGPPQDCTINGKAC